MAELETVLFPEEAKPVHCDCNLINSDHEVFVPIITDCMTDGADASVDSALRDGAYPSESLIHFSPGEKSLEMSDAKNAAQGLKSGCPKEIMESRVLVDPKGLLPMNLIGKSADIESGREIGRDNGCDGSFWGSRKRLFRKALNSFIPGGFGQSFIGSIKAVEPTFYFNAKVGLSKPAEDPLKSGFANLSQKSECSDGRDPRNTILVGFGKLRIENARNNINASSKKPPRPPRPSRQAKATIDPSKEKLVKGILRRIKLERMATLKKKQIARSKASNSSVWALAFTLFFCLIMIMQGIFSQGNNSAHISPEAAVQPSTFSVHEYNNHTTNGERWHPLELDQPSASLYHFRAGMDKTRLTQTDPKS